MSGLGQKRRTYKARVGPHRGGRLLQPAAVVEDLYSSITVEIIVVKKLKTYQFDGIILPLRF